MPHSPSTQTRLDDPYAQQALRELSAWQREMMAAPRIWNTAARHVQARINRAIPDRIHQSITATVRELTKAVLAGSYYTAPVPSEDLTLEQREQAVDATVRRYARTAAIEGGLTGAGGFLVGLADFPLLLGIKLKFLFDIAALYGHSTEDYVERLYILHVFQLAFSGNEHRSLIYQKLVAWPETRATLPTSLDEVDWRTFQQEYRDYIDLPKLAQLLPVVGAPVGMVVNNQLLQKLGKTARNAYRLRWFELPRC